jgi:hypothetical protein
MALLNAGNKSRVTLCSKDGVVYTKPPVVRHMQVTMRKGIARYYLVIMVVLWG